MDCAIQSRQVAVSASGIPYTDDDQDTRVGSKVRERAGHRANCSTDSG
jgi:hypothetical protein